MFSSVIIIPFLIVWFVVVSKSILFWIYLWQLKEYHIGRFLDHFRTSKGRKLLFNAPTLLKIFFVLIFVTLYAKDLRNPSGSFLFVIFYFTIIALFLLVLFPLYCVQCIKTIKDYLNRNIKKPVFTRKTIILTSIIGFLTIVFSSSIFVERAIFLVIYDLLVPIIVSSIILIFQPFFVIARNRILEKAKKKISGFKNLTVIGITGSYGKTSTKEFLTTILSEKFNVLATPEHKNSEMGIAQTILEGLNENHEIFIVEMGAYRKGGIKLLCDIVSPKIGIVTGVNEQHLALFGSMENLLSAEGGMELLNSIPHNGLLIVNGDNKYCLDLYKRAKTIGGGGIPVNAKTYTAHKYKIESDIWAEEIEVKKDSLSFVAMTKKRDMAHFEASVLGRQNTQNLLGAILTAKELGMSFDEISKACEKIMPGQGGMTMKKGAFGMNVIDSSYSSNPDGVIADLDYLKTFEGKKAVVMPCLIELGAKSADVHRQIGVKIAESCDIAIIATKDKFKEIKTGAVEKGMAEDRIIFCENPKEIFNLITVFYFGNANVKNTQFQNGLNKKMNTVLLEGRVPKKIAELLINEKPA